MTRHGKDHQQENNSDTNNDQIDTNNQSSSNNRRLDEINNSSSFFEDFLAFSCCYIPKEKETIMNITTEMNSGVMNSNITTSDNDYNNKCNNKNNSGSTVIIEPYHMFKLRKDATKIEIKKSYQRLALLYHPNRNDISNEMKYTIFIIISASYETLIDNESRNRLDSLLVKENINHQQQNHVTQSLIAQDTDKWNNKKKNKQNKNHHHNKKQRILQEYQLKKEKSTSLLRSRQQSSQHEQQQQCNEEEIIQPNNPELVPKNLLLYDDDIEEKGSTEPLLSSRGTGGLSCWSCKSDDFYSCASIIREETEDNNNSSTNHCESSNNSSITKLITEEIGNKAQQQLTPTSCAKNNSPLFNLDSQSEINCNSDEMGDIRNVNSSSPAPALPSIHLCGANCSETLEALHMSILPNDSNQVYWKRRRRRRRRHSSTLLLGKNNTSSRRNNKLDDSAVIASDSSITTKQSSTISTTSSRLRILRKHKSSSNHNNVHIGNFFPSLVRAQSSSSSQQSLLDQDNDDDESSSCDDSSCFSETSTVDGESRHYTSLETNRLFGGPLSLLYKARRFQSFTDPYILFQSVFGSAALHYNTTNTTSLSTNVDTGTTTVEKRKTNILMNHHHHHFGGFTKCVNQMSSNDYDSRTMTSSPHHSNLMASSFVSNMISPTTTSMNKEKRLAKISSSLSTPILLLPHSSVKCTNKARMVQKTNIYGTTTTAIVRTDTRSFHNSPYDTTNNYRRRVVRSTQAYKDPDTGIVKTCITVQSDYDNDDAVLGKSSGGGTAKRNNNNTYNNSKKIMLMQEHDRQQQVAMTNNKSTNYQWDCLLIQDDPWFLSTTLCC